jgi:hypothetical protein
MFKKIQCLSLLAAVFAFLVAAPNNFAQTTFGSVVGNVTDPSGAAVGSTEVTLTNLGTSEKRTDTTNADGLYQFVNLPPGQYSVEVQKPGFKRIVRTPVTVETQTTTKIDLALEVGQVSQTVEVTAQTPLIQAETSTLGQVIDERKTDTLPLNGRNPLNLVALVPSVVPQGGAMTNPNGQNPFAWGNYQIGGGMANQSMVWLDGSPVNGSYINITALIPTQDSLQEFKVATNDLPPEYGRFAGGVVNFTTKSGTNQLHGTLWEYLRNRDLDANDFFSNLNGTPRGAFTQNQFGFNVGGPIFVPKIYNGKDKTFFFVDYEGFRLRQGQSYTETVPTAQERTGDLSALAASQGVNIYDPLTTCGTGAPGTPACAAGVAVGTRQPFAGNVIPTSRINPTSLLMLKLYPMPNAAGNAQGVNNWVSNSSQGGNNNETVVHIDQNVSDKQHISARYTYWGNLNLPTDPFHNGVCQDRCTETFNTNNFVLGDTYSFSPTTIMEVRLSYQRFNYDRTPVTIGYDLTQLGWPAALNTEAVFRDLPVPVINGFDTNGTFGSQGAGSVIIDRNDNYRAAATLTKIAGNHTFKFGGEFLRLTHNYAQTNVPTGIFDFNPDLTAQNANNTAGSGLGLATFLLGYPSGGNASSPALVAAQTLYPALFANDDWHVTPKLTVNLGVRWEHAGPWTERFNRISFFNPTQPNSVLSAAGITAPGNVDLVNSTNDSYRSAIRPDWKQFAPRAGLAYQMTSKTVFHAGYGVFWLPNDVAWDTSPNNDPINSYSTPVLESVFTGVPACYPANCSAGSAVTASGAYTIANPFPGGIIGPPGRSPNYAQTLLGTGQTWNQLGNPYGYAQQWNADIQQQFGNGFLIDVAYGGAKGTHLPIDSPQIDQLPDQYLSLGNALLQNVANPYYGQVTASGSSLAQPTVQLGQLLRPYPEYTGVGFAGEGIGDSTYESLQVKAEKRFSAGGSLLVAYTHSKLISNTDTITGWLEAGGGPGGIQDSNNIRLDKSLASFDTPDRLVVSYVLDVPVGRGRKFLTNANWVENATIGGWGVEGVTTLQSGFPLHLGDNTNNSNSFGGGQRPNVVAGCNTSISGSITSKLNEYFNTACFTQPAPFTFGDESRTDPHLRAPGIAQWDFSAFKNFPLTPENKATLQFRAEFFNLFNRVQFGYPGQSFGSSSFGVIGNQQNNPRLVQFALRLAF